MSSQKPAETPTKEPLGDGTKGDAPKEGSRLRAFGGNVLALFVSLVVALLLGELALAVLGMEYSASLYTGDRQTGWALRPGAEGFQIGEATQYVRINSEGLRDEEHALPKPADTFRIAVLGDSFSAALEVPPERAYWSVLEDRLGKCAALGAKKVEVVNFGVGGFGQGHELMMLRSRVGKYAPDLVLTQIYLGNDIFNNSREMSKAQDQAVPYFVFEGDQLVLDTSYQSMPNLEPGHIARMNLLYELVNHSRVGLLIYSTQHALAQRELAPAMEGGKLDTERDLDPGPRERALFAAPERPELAQAWRITEGLFDLLHAEARVQGAELWLATLSMPVQVYPDAAKRENLMKKLGQTSLFYADERVRDYATKKGISVSTLAPRMAAEADRTNTFFHGFPTSKLGIGHWNEDGHRLGGELLAGDLCAAFEARKAPATP
jgi:hypothetical protein